MSERLRKVQSHEVATDKLYRVTFDVCGWCLESDGATCCEPYCAFYRGAVPRIPRGGWFPARVRPGGVSGNSSVVSVCEVMS